MITENCIIPPNADLTKAPTFLDCIWGIVVGDYASISAATEAKSNEPKKPRLSNYFYAQKKMGTKRKQVIQSIK